MSVLAIDWGDVPTWVSAITTLGALIAAGWVVRIELTRDQRFTDRQERSEQADRVAVWRAVLRGTPRVMLSNGSGLPIFDVQVSLMHRSSGERTSMLSERVIPPGDHANPYPEAIIGYGSAGPVRDTSEEWDFTMQFTDTAGRRWTRWPDGRLTRLPEEF